MPRAEVQDKGLTCDRCMVHEEYVEKWHIHDRGDELVRLCGGCFRVIVDADLGRS